MSGNSYYGDNVNMYGGSNNKGIVKYQSGGEALVLPPAVVTALRELYQQIEELRRQVSGPNAQLITDSLPALEAEATVPAQERHRALVTIAGVASTLGAVGQPVAEAVRTILGMLGG